MGSADYVAPDEIKGTLDVESPESVALNAGYPRPFPRVNSYLLIQVDDAFLVGQAEWLTIERSPFPKRRGMQDFGIVDLPYPLRRIKLNPLGMLRKTHEGEHEDECEDQCDKEKCKSRYDFQRGSDALPSVGAAVFLPTERQLRAIIESGKNRRVKIGISPLAGDAEVRIDPNRLFGRHLAVLGNTGSGKSCSVAGLIRWSLEAAKAKSNEERPNARFIVLDPNGEYSRAFKDDGTTNARIFKVNPVGDELQLKVPLWFWNSEEWCTFAQASAKTQRPALVHALGLARSHQISSEPSLIRETRRFIRTLITILVIAKDKGDAWARFPKDKGFYEMLEKWKESLEENIELIDGGQKVILQNLIDKIENTCQPRRAKHANRTFKLREINEILRLMREAHAAFGGSDSDFNLADVDSPLPFESKSILDALEASGEILGVSEHIETLLLRVKRLLGDTRIKPLIDDENCESGGGTGLDRWLEDYIGANEAKNGNISIIDLSLVPIEIVHIVTAVIARMVFEALQRYMKLNKETLPTVLVMEEAHTFVKRYKWDIENHDAASICCQVFERIAREGRKFGLGLVLSSQRPSELSETVLSQCNTFLLHRISNNRDQELVQKLVPDNLKGLLRELPLLPSQRAVLLGWASELPVLVKMRDLPVEQQPQSNDPEVWETWLGQDDNKEPVERKVNWREITNKWQSGISENQTSQGDDDDAEPEEGEPEEYTGDGDANSE